MEIVDIRRQIHAQPELSFEERATAELTEKELSECGFKVGGRIAGTGFFADRGSNPRVAVRCEMDAIAMSELNSVAYRSRVPNVCHACGHDAHVAAVIGFARLLSAGAQPPVRIIMQPGEEKCDAEGVTGAEHVVKSGALSGIQTLVGLHVDATMPAGCVAVLPIQSRHHLKFSAELRGQQMLDTLPLLLTKLRENARVKLDELKAVETLVTMSGCAGTSDTFDEQSIKSSLAACFAEYESTIAWDGEKNPVATVDVNSLIDALATVVGKTNTQLSRRKTWSSSLTEYARHVSAVLLLFGAELRGSRRSQHTPSFDIDENCLPVGAQCLLKMVEELGATA